MNRRFLVSPLHKLVVLIAAVTIASVADRSAADGLSVPIVMVGEQQI